MLTIGVKYLKKNTILLILGIYLSVAISLHFLFHINIFPPCLLKMFTGKSCLGCGMTRGFLSMLTGDWMQAWHFNPLVFLFVPLFIVWLVYDFYIFFKKEKK